MGVFILCILQNQIKTAKSGGQGGKIGYIQVGVLADGGKAVVEGISVGAIPIREGQFPAKQFVELLRGVQILDVDIDLLHLRSSNT